MKRRNCTYGQAGLAALSVTSETSVQATKLMDTKNGDRYELTTKAMP